LQEILKKPLTSADMDVLAALYTFYGLSAHYILSLVDYCATICKRGMAYAEKVAVSWMNDGVDDSIVDKHIDTLMRRHSNEGMVRREFGINDRSLTTKEKEFIARWFDEFGFDIAMIKLAFEITVDRTGKTAFNYLNKILQNWQEKGIKTPDDVKQESENYAKQSNQSSEPAAAEIDKLLLEQFMKE
ncbi:MAG: DnaD domain protein, partial [Oscillospiraceae bacterium]|nr:DnaD domain protein [Oscillospiraceae bacterium]